ncbi:hypothetical protein GIB67_025920 [Kingdonia uniflora]|uniref:Uncharacterized protein n=1 Tax=Kingdonia uniflora TaxID=39325 RepID=A0A7J7NYZ5_9MAGN|nr:hypothetical protein GIB67_025920 [Kingdonia uniflora]
MTDATIANSNSRSCSQFDCNGGDDGIGLSSVSYAEIIVVRHGETAWNADGKIQVLSAAFDFKGHLDVELNEAGRQQATAVAHRLSKEPKISAIYSSDLKRALETAQIIADSCGILECD